METPTIVVITDRNDLDGQLFGVFSLAQRLDAEYQVHTSSDGMTATLSIIPPVGGKPAAPEQALHALTLAGVVFGIDQTAVSQACQKGSCSHVIVARGVHAQDGADAAFEDLVPHTVNREPTLDENGLIRIGAEIKEG